MNVKKSLENRLRGWLPQEPVLKAPLKAQISPVNRGLSFKARRWLHGFSAFMISLWRHSSLRFKMKTALFGVLVLSEFFMFFLVTRNLIGFYSYNFAVFMLLLGYGALQWGISRYLERKEPHKNQPIENMNPLRLGGTIIGVAAVPVLVYSTYLMDFVYPKNPSAFPFYLTLVGVFMFLIGWGLFAVGRKRSKYSHSLNSFRS